MCVVGSVRLQLLWMTLRGHISCKQSEESDVCEVRVSEPSELHHPGAPCWWQCAEYSQGVFYHLDIYFSSQLLSILLFTLDKRPMELLDISYHPFHLCFLWAIF